MLYLLSLTSPIMTKLTQEEVCRR